MTLTPDSRLPESMMLGLDLFKDKAILFDYPHQQILVADNIQALRINQAEGWMALPLRLSSEGIVINVSQGVQSYKMVLDTGASASVIWKERLKSPFKNLSCRTVMTEMDNEGCVATQLQLNEIGVTGSKLNAVVIDGTFKHVQLDGLLGTNFLKQFAVVIDFPGKKLLIKDNQKGGTVLPISAAAP